MKNPTVTLVLKYIQHLLNIDVKILLVTIIITVESLIFIGAYFDGMTNFFFRMLNSFREITCL